MRSGRMLAVVVLVAVVASMVALDRADPIPAPVGTALPPVQAIPVAAHPEAAASNWYCPVGVGRGVAPNAADGLASSFVVVSNAGTSVRRGTITFFTSKGPASPVRFSVGAGRREQFDVRGYTKEAHAAALVEMDGGAVAVADVVKGPDGADVVNCETTAGHHWFLPFGATTLDANAELWLFNPFADDAVLRIALTAGAEVRVPSDFESFPVPARSLVVLPLNKRIAVRPQFVTEIEASVGRVIPALVQTYDGSKRLQGLTVVSGTQRPSTEWWFPVGRRTKDTEEQFVVWNPSDRGADVEVDVRLDGAGYGPVAPFTMTVAAQSYVVVSSTAESFGRVPAGVGHTVVVRSRNDVEVVAAQRYIVTGSQRPGIAVTLGSSIRTMRWLVPVASLTGAGLSVTVSNPSMSHRAHVVVESWAGGKAANQIERAKPVTIPSQQRVSLAIGDLFSRQSGLLQIRSDQPVVVMSGGAVAGGGRILTLGVPVSRRSPG